MVGDELWLPLMNLDESYWALFGFGFLLRYGTFVRRWGQKWTLIMKFRDKSSFSQCDVCQELKAQLLRCTGQVFKVFTCPNQFFWLMCCNCTWCFWFCLWFIVIPLRWNAWMGSEGFKTKASPWISGWVHYDCTGSTSLTNTPTGARFGVSRTYQLSKCLGHAPSWQMVLIKTLSVGFRISFCFCSISGTDEDVFTNVGQWGQNRYHLANSAFSTLPRGTFCRVPCWGEVPCATGSFTPIML